MPGELHQKIINKHIVLLEIDHLEANSLNKVIKKELFECFKKLKKDKAVRCVIITGRGSNFCCGDDLNEAASNMDNKTALKKNLKSFAKLMDELESLPMPTIAAIDGWCIGGGLELALCCDIRIATNSAQFITAGVKMGLTASANRLPKIIGLGPAKRMLLTGDTFGSEEALHMRLITDRVPSDQLLQSAIRIAQSICDKAPLAVRASKRIAHRVFELPQHKLNAFTLKEQLRLAKSRDHQHALESFLNKKSPEFKGDLIFMNLIGA